MAAVRQLWGQTPELGAAAVANAIFVKYKEAIISGGTNTDLSAGNVKVVMVDAGAYTYSSTHQFLSDIPVGARIATSANLGSKTVTNGTFGSAAASFTGVSGVTVEYLVIYIDTGSAATSRLVAFYDTATGLVFTPSGTDVTVTPASGNWFTL